MKHRLPTSLLLLLAALPLFAEDPPGDKPEEPKPDTPKPKTHKVAPGLFKISFEADGVFASSGTREISIDTQSWGVLTVLEAQPHGALVKKGDTLVKLDLEKIEQKLRELRFGLEVSTLDLQVAEAELKLLESTSPMELAALERSNQRVQEDLELFLKTQLPHQKQSAEVSLKGAKDALAYAEEELNQLRKMYEADDLTEETEEIILKRAQASVDRAKFALKGAELRKSETFRHTLPRKTLDIEESARRSELSLQATVRPSPSHL